MIILEIIIFLCNILHIFFLYKKLVPYFFLWWKYPYFQYACVDQEWEHDITPHANNGHAFSPHIFPGTNVGHADGGITRTMAKRKLMNTQKPEAVHEDIWDKTTWWREAKVEMLCSSSHPRPPLVSSYLPPPDSRSYTFIFSPTHSLNQSNCQTKQTTSQNCSRFKTPFANSNFNLKCAHGTCQICDFNYSLLVPPLHL